MFSQNLSLVDSLPTLFTDSNPSSFRPVDECTPPFPLPPPPTPIQLNCSLPLSKTGGVPPQSREFPTPTTITYPYPSLLQMPPQLLFVFLPPSHPPVIVLLTMYPHLLFGLTLAPAVDPPTATSLVVQFEARVFKISKWVVLQFLSLLLISCQYIFFLIFTYVFSSFYLRTVLFLVWTQLCTVE